MKPLSPRAAGPAGLLLAILVAGAAPASPAAAAGRAPPTLDSAEVERAVRTFDKVQAKGGMIGAQVYSRGCHKKAARTRSWAKRDFCAAFDLAADFLDNAAAERMRFPRNEYFNEIAGRQPEYYRDLSDDSAAVAARLYAIVDIVKPALLAAIEARTAGK